MHTDQRLTEPGGTTVHLTSVNCSLPRTIDIGGRPVTTGIAKEPVEGPVAVTADGLVGDGVGNTKDHGGPDQAVYLYSLSDYRWWAEHDGLEPHPGLFGENLTVDELATAAVEVGDRLQIGEVELEVTAPRIPCATLAGRVGDGRFAREFAAARRPGAYLRVRREGTIEAGTPVTMVPGGSGVTLAACMDAYYDIATVDGAIHRLLASPLAVRLRHRFADRLAGDTDQA